MTMTIENDYDNDDHGDADDHHDDNDEADDHDDNHDVADDDDDGVGNWGAFSEGDVNGLRVYILALRSQAKNSDWNSEPNIDSNKYDQPTRPTPR